MSPDPDPRLADNSFPPAEKSKGCVAIVDDDEHLLAGLGGLLGSEGYEIFTFSSPRDALAVIEPDPTRIDLLLVDLHMPDVDGLELLGLVRAQWPDMPVIMMTGDGSIPTVVRAMRLGAYDYLSKPFENTDEVTLTIDRALERQRLVKRNRQLERQLGVSERFEGMVGDARAMQLMFQTIEAAAPTDATVLLLGESGTGKELVARALHARSSRRAGPFVPVNCSALTETLLESELFGHVRGAFSGASSQRAGMFEEASSGTLFLDEIGDISPRLQVSLLRALQEGEIKPVGSSAPRKVDTRVVAATNRDLREAVEAGAFRADLYYRLNVVAIDLPPLRDRADDIPALVHCFLRKYAVRHGKNVARIAPDALEALQAYPWPGNVRELENLVQRAVVLATSEEIGARDLPPTLRPRSALRARRNPGWNRPFAEVKGLVVAKFEREYVESVMARTHGNLTESARLAGMDRANFRRLARRHDIDLDRLRLD